MQKETPKTIPISVRVPLDAYQRLRELAHADDRPISSLARRAVTEWLSRNARKKPAA